MHHGARHWSSGRRKSSACTTCGAYVRGVSGQPGCHPRRLAPSAPARSNAEVMEDLEVLRLRDPGLRLVDYAQMLGMSHAALSRAICRYKERLRSATMEDAR